MIIVAAILPIQPAISAPKVSVSASLDSTTLLMGQTTNLHLSVQKPADITGHFPIFSNNDSKPYATLLGDTIEVSKSYSTDTIKLSSGLNEIRYSVPIQVFDSGTYLIPGFQYIAGSDTLLTNTLKLNVVPVNAQATDEIAPLTDVADPAPGSWLDSLPDWLLQYWWAILLGLIILATAAWFIVKTLKHRKPKTKPVKVVPPYEEAIQALNKLKQENLWQSGDSEAYFVKLTDILRRYLSRRFNVSAPEMTTTQFLEEISRNATLTAYRSELGRLLQLADFIKFAKGQAMPSENEEAFNIVLHFVEQTKPTPEEMAATQKAQTTAATKEGKEGKHDA